MMFRAAILRPSPNFDDRPPGAQIKYLILHYTGMATGEAALARLCDEKSKVSAHYFIDEDGLVYALVDEDRRAWHAGKSAWQEDRDINGLSIGIELVNPGHDSPGYVGDYRDFPAAQMSALIILCQDILARHDIKPWHILAHSDIAPDRKIDPGEKFDWQALSEKGIGIWPKQGKIAQSTDVRSFQRMLAEYGYPVDITGTCDAQTQQVISAFQRHFRPADFTGRPDGESAGILGELLMIRSAKLQ